MSRLIPDNILAAITIYQEAAGEPYEGKLAVAEVIRNRMTRRYSSDGSVAGTVLRAWQFSGWNTDAGPVRIKSLQVDGDNLIVRQCLAAWTEATEMRTDSVKGAVLYLNPETALKQAGVLPEWARDGDDHRAVNASLVLATVGRHVFLKG